MSHAPWPIQFSSPIPARLGIKLGLFDLSSTEPALLCKGLLDEHEAGPRLIFTDPRQKLFQ